MFHIFKQPSLSSYLGEQIRPGNDCKSNEQLDEIIRNTGDTAYHPSCTNKMGIDKMSVVDEETKVHGIENLRIIDSSKLKNNSLNDIKSNFNSFLIQNLDNKIFSKKIFKSADVKSHN